MLNQIKKYLILTFLLLCIKILPQNNGGFENWTTVGSYQEPDNWQTLNFVSQFGNPLSAFKVSGPDKYSGNYALKITSVYFPFKILPQLPDTLGFAFNGKIKLSPPSYQIGSVYTARPAKLSFYSKYIPVGVDTGYAGVVLYRSLPSGRDTIGEGAIIILSSGIYSNYKINIAYRSSVYPDSANIYFQASNRSNGKRVGSSIFIDDVAFTGGVGIEEFDTFDSKINLYPNPASNLITINAQTDEAYKVEVINITGQVINCYDVNNYFAQINTEQYCGGCYFYRVLNKKNELLKNGKFIVAK